MTAASDRQIPDLLETRTRAFGRRDAATAAAGYDDDLVLCDAVGPFVRRGEDPAGRLERWMASYRTGIGHEIRDPEITTGADLAFRHFPVRISGTMRDGTEVGIWVRATSCLRRQRTQWECRRCPAAPAPPTSRSTSRATPSSSSPGCWLSTSGGCAPHDL
ncbi:YybH family protein [Streptomyces asiaticus]